MSKHQSDDARIGVSLLALRLSVFVVFTVWTIDKLTNYEHSSGVIMHYYHVAVPQWFVVTLGLLEMVLLLAFLVGVFKTLSYGLVLLAHTASTVVSSWRLIPPYEIHQLLYFGSLPLLAACFALFLLRDRDVMMNFPRNSRTSPLG